MTILARTVAASCLLALLAGLGPAEASWMTRPPTRIVSAESLPGASLTHFAVYDNTPADTTPFVDEAMDPATSSPLAEDTENGEAETVLWEEYGGGWLDSSCYDFGHPRWRITHDAVLLRRSAARPLDLLFSPLPVLNAADLGFNYEVGPRVSLTRYFGRDWGLEANYLSIDGWTSSAVRDGDPLILYPPGVMASTQFAVGYSSELHSAELNLRYRCHDRIDLLAGFRHVELQEDFNVVGALVPPQTSIPRYDMHAANYLYGFQIGTDARLFDRGGLFRLDGFIKAGVYGNNAHQETSRIGNLGIPVTAGDRRNNAAFLGEFGLTGVCRLGEHVSLRGGYQVMWIEGVALAPDQIPHTDVSPFSSGVATLDTSGSSVYYGGHAGLEVRW